MSPSTEDCLSSLREAEGLLARAGMPFPPFAVSGTEREILAAMRAHARALLIILDEELRALAEERPA